MSYDTITNKLTPTLLLEKLLAEKKSGYELQKRKHEDWNDNYELDRNKVKVNRLTQRQAVNIPLMKETRKTLLSKIDDPPNVEWQELSGDEQKEIYFQEVWNEHLKSNNLEMIDVLDKNNVLMYGLSTKFLNVSKNGVEIGVLDIYDVLYDPLMNPWDLESARFIIRQNIFRSIREILADDRYSEEGKNDLRMWADSVPGITQGEYNKEEWEKKMERLRSMGVKSSDFPLFAGGDRVVNLTEHYTRIWNTTKQEFEKRVVVYADDHIQLMDELLEDLIGVDFWPFVRWSEDPQILDIYPDSIADTIRTPNKVLNVWFSQLIENRTLKNFQMHWFNPVDGYTPQTYTPGPGMMLPAPPTPDGDVRKSIMPVEVSGLDDTLQAISSVIQIAERATGATAIEKGQAEKGTQTLGEVEILVGKAGERATAMAKFYRLAWYELAVKWNRMLHANALKFVKVFKVGKSGKVYPKRVFAGDWKSDMGYEPMVSSSSEQEQNELKSIQKFQFILSQFPNNIALRKIAQKRELELLDLTPEELKQVQDAEDQVQNNQLNQVADTSDIQSKIGELANLTI